MKMKDKKLYICVYGAAGTEIDKIFIDEAETLGFEMAKRNMGLIFGGGATGVMGAVARGTKKGGGTIIGIAPSFFDTEGVLYRECSEFIYPEDMRERKGILEKRADCFIACPGGIGTLDEFFEILTLKQLGRHNKKIVLLNIDGYFDPLIELLRGIVQKRFAGEDILSLFKVCRSAKEALDYIEES